MMRLAQRAVFVALFAVALAAAGPDSSSAQQAEIFEGMAGKWIGKGSGRIGPGEPDEKIYCRITNNLSTDGKALEQDGRCAIGNATGSIKGRIEAQGEGSFGGHLASPAMKDGATVSGRGDARQLDLTAAYEDARSGRRINSQLLFELLEDGAYRMTTTATDIESGEVFRASEIVFRRQ
jgi:hypothetical protein